MARLIVILIVIITVALAARHYLTGQQMQAVTPSQTLPQDTLKQVRELEQELQESVQQRMQEAERQSQ